MQIFTARLKRFDQNGEKTRWTYIDIPADVTDRLCPGRNTSFRVSGTLDDYPIERVALIPMGRAGDTDRRFIMGINAVMRRHLRKEKGATITVNIQLDDAPLPPSADLMACLADDPAAQTFFQSLTKGHQNYFSRWIDDAKTAETKTRRLTQTVWGLSMGMGYGEMIRYFKAKRLPGE